VPKLEFIPLWTGSPPEFLHHLSRLSDLSTGPDLPKFRRPLTASSNEPPVLDRAVTPTPGSAPRFSQPLSGFSSKSKFHGFISCRNRFWTASFRAFPSRRSWHLLRLTSSPAVIHPWLKCVACGLITSRFCQLSRLTKGAIARLPRATKDSLSIDPKVHVPVVLGHRRRVHSPPPASSALKRSSLRESVRVKPELPRANGRYSPGFRSPL